MNPFRHLLVAAIRVPVTAVFVLALAAAAALYMASPAVPATGNAGPATVTVTPTSGLTDGQALTINAKVPSGTELFEIRAHLCAPNAGISNTYDFSFQGSFCSKAKPGAGDNETVVALPRGSTSADLGFKAGVGTMSWTDEDWTTPNPHTVTCGPDSPCDLVVQLQITDDTVFYTVPLCYGATCPKDPAAAPSTPPAAGGSAGSGGAAAVGAADSSAASAAAANGATSGGATAGGAAAATAQGRSGVSSVSSGDPSGSGSNPEDIATAVFGSPVVHRAVRVFTAGVVGAIGGLVIALIIARARRQMRTAAA
jgi:hypothetical protein